MRLFVSSNSLALPRRETPEAETWPHLLAGRLGCAVVNVSTRGALAEDCLARLEAAEAGDLAVVHAGVVECIDLGVDRHKERIRRVWARFGSPDARYLSRWSRARMRSMRQIRRTILGAVSAVPVVVLPCLRTTAENLRRHPLWDRSVDRVNACWREWCRLDGGRQFVEPGQVSAGAAVDELVLSDGCHYSTAGHRAVAAALWGVAIAQADRRARSRASKMVETVRPASK